MDDDRAAWCTGSHTSKHRPNRNPNGNLAAYWGERRIALKSENYKYFLGVISLKPQTAFYHVFGQNRGRFCQYRENRRFRTRVQILGAAGGNFDDIF